VQGQRELRWHFTNLEPDTSTDIAVSFRPMYSQHNTYGGASASSGAVRAPEYVVGRSAGFFADSKLTTAWISAGETVGAWLGWQPANHLDTTPTLGLGILPGVAGDSAAYRAHGRPKDVRVRLAQLRPGMTFDVYRDNYFRPPPPELEVIEYRLQLADTPRWQFLRLDTPVFVVAYEVHIESVYPGQRYQDVAIAEVLFPLLEEDLPLEGKLLPRTGGLVDGWLDLPALGLLLAAVLAVLGFGLRRRAAQA
jgi:hypothetical protein